MNSLQRQTGHSISPSETTYFLSLDIGNTKTSAGLFKGDELVGVYKSETERLCNPKSFEAFINAIRFENQSMLKIKPQIGVCSVVPKQTQCLKTVLENFEFHDAYYLSHNLNFPFKIRYLTPESLGMDRLALVASCYAHFRDTAVIVIDFGTAITYDILTSKQEYIGGLILAGPKIISECLHEKTAQLPVVMLEKQENVIGQSTESCLKRGLYWGLIAQSQGLIHQLKLVLKEQYQETDCKVIITGGYHELIRDHLTEIDVCDPNAVLRGIRTIVRYKLGELHEKK